MPISLPDSPTDGQTVQIGTIIYTYDASAGVWNSNSAAGPTLTPATVTTSDTAPTNPNNGDMWFDSSVGKTFIWYDDGTSTQWVQMSPNTQTGPAGADGADGSSVAVYANFAAFVNGTTEGDFAFAQDTKALYVWDGTEWDRIYSGSNETPTWTTEPNANYDLEEDGTATIISVSATDPEGFPITYTYDTNPSNQSQATISESNGTFTITPSTNESDEGEFTLRIKATDGLHITSKSSAMKLDFYSVPQKSSLLYGLDAQRSSNEYDRSGNGLTGTLQNGTTYNTGTPSYYEFDGDDDYIDLGTIGVSDPLQLYNLSNGYTISAWIRVPDYTGDSSQRIIDKSSGGSGQDGWYLAINNVTNGDWVMGLSTNNLNYSSNRILVNKWEMITVVVDYTSTTLKYYKNGFETASWPNFAVSNYEPPQVETTARIGTWNHDVAREFKGRIGNVLVWGTPLTAAEVTSLYTFLKPDYTSEHINDIELSLGDPTSTFAAGTILNSDIHRSNPVVFSCDVVFPVNPTDGILFEQGGTGIGAWVGLRDSGTVFRIRGGDGTTTVPDTDTAFLDITSFPTDGAKHNVMWEYHPINGTIRCWIDGVLKGTASTTDNSPMDTDTWAGTDDGGFGQGGGVTAAPVGEPTSNWPAGIDTHERLRYWNNTVVT